MTGNVTIVAGIVLLACGTWLMRFAGAKLGNRLALSDHARQLLSDAATTLLFAVALGNTFYEGVQFAGIARVAGVAVAVLLAWRKTPLIVVILAAAAVTALLRYAGIP
ncbi:AzlD domain-containing protein [Erwinia sp. Eh17-17]|jgi:branched-subunit amino acid transport protein|uniref:AzlD domain-containing protein n=1 Tax=Erwinia sp. Eh17-17 TaxID=3080330 RepID=UPI00320B9A64